MPDINERICQCDNKGTDPDMEKNGAWLEGSSDPSSPQQEILMNSWSREIQFFQIYIGEIIGITFIGRR